MDCAVSPDGAYLDSASQDGTLALWDPESGEELRTLVGHTDAVSGCAWSPNGGYLVSASQDGTLKLWDPESGEELRTLAGHTDVVLDCAVSPDGAYLVSASLDASLRLRASESGEELATIQLLGPLRCAALHPRLPLAACGDAGGSVHLIELVAIEGRSLGDPT